MKPLGRLAALAAVGVGLGCRASAPGPWHEEPGYRWRDAADPGRRTAGFTSMKGGTTGITFRNDVSADKAFANDHLALLRPNGASEPLNLEERPPMRSMS